MAAVFAVVVSSFSIYGNANAADPGAASASISITASSSSPQSSGTAFNYTIQVACSGTNTDDSCKNTVVSFPVTSTMSGWGFSSVPYGSLSSDKSSYSFTIGDMAIGTNNSYSLSIQPPAYYTPNNTSWSVQPTVSWNNNSSTNQTSQAPTPVTYATSNYPSLIVGESPSYSSDSGWISGSGTTFYVDASTSGSFYEKITPTISYLAPQAGSEVITTIKLPSTIDYKGLVGDTSGLTTSYDSSTHTLTVKQAITKTSTRASDFILELAAASGTTNSSSNGEIVVESSYLAIGETGRTYGTAKRPIAFQQAAPGSNGKNAYGNTYGTGGNSILNETDTSIPFSYTLKMGTSSVGYNYTITDYFTCYSNSFAERNRHGYTSANDANCADPAVKLKGIAFNSDNADDSVTVNLILKGGGKKAVTVPTTTSTDTYWYKLYSNSQKIDQSLNVVGIEVTGHVSSQAKTTYTGVILYMSYADNSKIEYSRTGDFTPFYFRNTETMTWTMDSGSTGSKTESVDVTPYKNSGSTASSSDGVYTLAGDGHVNGAKTSARAYASVKTTASDESKARSVVLLPKQSDGFTSMSTWSPYSDAVKYVSELGGTAKIIKNYQGTGRVGVEVTGGTAANLENFTRNTGSGTFTPEVSNGKPGVYTFDVYSGVDGATSATCVSGDVEEAPSFWAVSGTTLCHSSSTITLLSQTNSYALTKQIRTSDTAEWSDSTDAMQVSPTGTAQYKINFTNTGPTALDSVVWYDMLPTPGDTGTVASQVSQTRGTNSRVVLTEVPTAPTGYTFQYSTATNPCRTEVNSNISGCTNSWTSTAPTDLTKIRAVRLVADSGTTLASGATLSSIFKVKFLDVDSVAAPVAWNSVSGVASVSGSALLPTETGGVGFATKLVKSLSVEKTAATVEPSSGWKLGDSVTWNYKVTNTGNVITDSIKVTDNRGVAVTCPASTLKAGESMTCTGTGTLFNTNIQK